MQCKTMPRERPIPRKIRPRRSGHFDGDKACHGAIVMQLKTSGNDWVRIRLRKKNLFFVGSTELIMCVLYPCLGAYFTKGLLNSDCLLCRCVPCFMRAARVNGGRGWLHSQHRVVSPGASNHTFGVWFNLGTRMKAKVKGTRSSSAQMWKHRTRLYG